MCVCVCVRARARINGHLSVPYSEVGQTSTDIYIHLPIYIHLNHLGIGGQGEVGHVTSRRQATKAIRVARQSVLLQNEAVAPIDLHNPVPGCVPLRPVCVSE